MKIASHLIVYVLYKIVVLRRIIVHSVEQSERTKVHCFCRSLVYEGTEVLKSDDLVIVALCFVVFVCILFVVIIDSRLRFNLRSPSNEVPWSDLMCEKVLLAWRRT
jgi:hypothetical protein